MLPSILAKQLQKGIGDYIETTFPMTNEPFKGSVEKMLANKGSVYHEPYVAVRLPFRVAEEMPTCFEAIHPAYLPYVHQQKAFERLTGDDGRSTLVATGTGSGKTECFLYPILEYCYQHRGERGIKALIIYPMNALATDQAKRIAELIYGSWIPRNSNAHLAVHSAILASELKSEGAVAVCAVLNDEKDHRTDKYEQEWNGFWRFHNLMQFADEFIAVSSTGMSRMNYLALPALVNAVSDPSVSATEIDDAWDAIIELMYDDDAKAFVELARDTGVPAPAEDNIGYEVEGDDGEVIATVEIAWPDKHVGFMTADQAEDKEKLENMGWKILNLLDAADMDTASLFGGDN